MEQESTNLSSVSKNPKQPMLENLITNFSRERFDYAAETLSLWGGVYS